jgi:hypothetical protein
MIFTLKPRRENKSAAESLTKERRPQRMEPPRCPSYCPAAQQAFVPAAGENKVGLQEENSSGERCKT